MTEAVQGTVWNDLDDFCVSAILSKLPASSLVSIQLLNKRVKQIAEADVIWRSPFATEFPVHYAQLGQHEGAPWFSLYRERHQHEKNWRRGHCCGPVEMLRAHSGPIFSTRFLLPPFPPNLAVSGGVYGQNEATELVLWDLSCRQEHVGRLGWRLGDNGGMDNLAGAFDVKQIPGTQQLVCSGFAFEVNLASLSQRPPPSSDSTEGHDAQGESSACQPNSPPPHTNLDMDGGGPWGSLPAGERGRGYQLRHTHTLVGHEAACPAVACQGDGLVATASFDGTLRLWRVPVEHAPPEEDNQAELQGQEAGRGGLSRGLEPSAELSSLTVLRDPFFAVDNPIFHSNAVCAVALSPDGTRLSSGGNDMQVKQWDVETGKVSLRLTGHEGWVWHVESLDESHRVLVSGGTDSSVRIWDTRAGRQVQRCNVCTETLYPIAGLCLRPPDQQYIVCGVFDGSVHIVDRRVMRVLYSLEEHSDRVTRVACDGDRILSGSFDALVNLWSF